MTIKAFCFNPFYENTYIIYEDTGEAWIFDPGCFNEAEETVLLNFIQSNSLKPNRLILTHAHIDHILGLDFFYQKFGLKAEMHVLELPVLSAAPDISKMYGIPFKPTVHNMHYLIDNQHLKLGNEIIDCIWVPGHSPGSLCFFLQNSKILIGGDVLFEGSIGRTDLPGGDYDTLISSIKKRLYPLGNEVVIYPGHGGLTTIGQEKLTNPFLTL